MGIDNIIIIVKANSQLDIKNKIMRDATKEEQDSVNNYINNISEDTGINFYDILN